MAYEIESYINKRYERWLEYAAFQATQAGIPDEAGDVLNTVLIDLIKKPDYLLLKLLKSKKNEGTELDFFVLRMIKINAHSPTSPYRYSTKSLPTDDNVQFSNIDIEDTSNDETDLSGDVFEKIEMVRNVLEELNLSDKAKDIFFWKFFEGNNFTDWPGEESLNDLCTTYKKVGKLIQEKLFTEEKSIQKPKAIENIQLSLF